MADKALGSRAGKSQTVRVEVPAHCEPLAAKMRSHPTTRSPSLGMHFLVVPSRLPQDRGGGIGYQLHLGKGKLRLRGPGLKPPSAGNFPPFWLCHSQRLPWLCPCSGGLGLEPQMRRVRAVSGDQRVQPGSLWVTAQVPPSSSPTPPLRVTFNHSPVGEEVGAMQTSSGFCRVSCVPLGKLLNLSGAQCFHCELGQEHPTG